MPICKKKWSRNVISNYTSLFSLNVNYFLIDYIVTRKRKSEIRFSILFTLVVY